MRLNRLLPLFVVSLLAACGGSANQQGAVPAAPAGIEAPPAPAAPPSAVGAVPSVVQPGGEAVEAAAAAVDALSPVASAVAATTPAAAGVSSSRWVLGKNYNQLVPAQPTDSPADKVEVVEVFWYGCGHCYHLDPYLENWRKKGRPAFVDFRRVPVMWNDINRQHARLFYVLQALGKLDQLHTAVFREIHANGNMLADQDPAKGEALQMAFLKSRGIAAADLKRVYRSFPVESNLQRAEVLTRRYQVTGVPMVVVSGKYTADVSSAGGEQQLLDLVNDISGGARRR
jgi:thiol:disulfide interchange protein DsbA